MAIFRRPAILHAPPRQPEFSCDPADAIALIMTLGRALLSLGSPAHRVEAALELMASRLGLKAQFFSAPTALFVTVDDGQQQQTYLARVISASTDLGKLAEIAEVMAALEQRQISPQQASDAVVEIYRAPSRYSRWLGFIAFPLVALPVTLLLGGGLRELMLGGVLSGIVGLLAMVMSERASGRLLVPMSATMTALVATVWCALDGHTAQMPALIAGMIVLLPGLDLTTATRELATGHLVSGSARLAATALVFATLAFGLALGSALGQWWAGPVPDVAAQPVSIWVQGFSLVIAAIGLAISLRVRLAQWIWVVAACFVAWGSAQLGQGQVGGSLGAFIGGVLVGLSGNAFARFTGLPGTTMHIPGLLLLVPGSMGLRSMAALLGADVVTGIEVAFTALLTAVALATGMITASVLLPPRNEL
ncbi:MAG: threonine/serine exporter family protein [Wenzhouxiangellaceae bacterium]